MGGGGGGGGGGGNILVHPVLSTQYFGFLWPIHC